jgi:hypothetical protein
MRWFTIQWMMWRALFAVLYLESGLGLVSSAVRRSILVYVRAGAALPLQQGPSRCCSLRHRIPFE